MPRFFTEKYYRIDLNTLPAEREKSFPNKDYLLVPTSIDFILEKTAINYKY